jgi:hypothetical protein
MIEISKMQGQHLENPRNGVSGWRLDAHLTVWKALAESLCAQRCPNTSHENQSSRGPVRNPVRTPVRTITISSAHVWTLT